MLRVDFMLNVVLPQDHGLTDKRCLFQALIHVIPSLVVFARRAYVRGYSVCAKESSELVCAPCRVPWGGRV